MNKIIFIAVLVATLCINAFGHQAFTLQNSEKVTVTDAQLADLQKQATVGAVEGANVNFSTNDIKLVVVTGPEDDMLSFRIQGLRNPNIVTPGDATLTIWFVNVDADMGHDLLFSHYPVDFPVAPDVNGAVGTQRLTAHDDPKAGYQAEKIVIVSNEDGAYRYFCSVRGHAKGGMWGNILVGVKPGGNMQMPDKQTHVHSPDEEKEADHQHPAGSPTPTPQHQHNTPMASPTPSPSHQHGGATPTPTPGHQHDMAGMQQGDTSNMPGMKHDQMNMNMRAVYNMGDPMDRESSGTAWAPDSSPMYAKMKMLNGGGMWMFMGTGFIRYTDIGSSRDVSVAGKGDRERFDAPTMLMAMYSHPIGEKAQFGFRSMFSLDPAIERGYGYPLLYQSGELYKGQPIHDRQHPHDLISELAVSYSYKFNDKRSFYLYAGLPAEPALGPPMYLHRVSGMNNPDAPIGHHWQDATHITYGVVTAGYSFGKVKFEASAFNGTEPDENRWNFDRPRLNSFSGRLSVNPTKNWSLQISQGYLRNPERSEPEVRILRKTIASAIYNKKFDDEHNWETSLVWGRNYANREGTNSFLAESNYDFNANAVFGRFETVQKSGHDLVLPAPFHEHDVFNVSKFSIGYVRDVVRNKGIDIGIGGMITANFNPSAIAPVYGGTRHGGWQLFVRFRPSKMH